MRFIIKRLFCHHYWVNETKAFSYEQYMRNIEDSNWIRVGLKDWRTNESWWGCAKCGKVKSFRYDFIPLNFENGEAKLT